MTLDRRRILQAGLAVSFASPSLATASSVSISADTGSTSSPFKPLAGKRSRVIFINDLSGDIDGLFATVHAILSPSIDLRAIVGTSTREPKETAERSAALGHEILNLMNLHGKIQVITGADSKISGRLGPVHCDATRAILAEAKRTDTKLPLFVAVGGGLTEIASAVMIDPAIADKMTLVWIGGDAFPAGGIGETNFNIDSLAAEFLYNETTVPIWQVPRSVYATCLVSAAELQAYVAPHGAIGKWLYNKVVDAPGQFKNYLNMGETWTLGDNPLVLLTALNDWMPSGYLPIRYENTGSSHFDKVIAPFLNKNGTFTSREDGRRIRIYNSVDTRLMFNDFFAKLRINFPTS